MTLRLFLALAIGEEVRRKLAALPRKVDLSDAKAKWVEAENLHLTLRFLGEVEEDRLGAVQSAAAPCAQRVGAFTFTVRGLVPIPDRGPLRMIWAGVEEPTGCLSRLAAELTEALTPLELHDDAEERSFRPHITLVRFRFVRDPDRIRAAVTPFSATDFGPTRAAELVLVQSQLTPLGPRYSPLARWPMG